MPFLKLSKTTSPQKLFPADCITLYSSTDFLLSHQFNKSIQFVNIQIRRPLCLMFDLNCCFAPIPPSPTPSQPRARHNLSPNNY